MIQLLHLFAAVALLACTPRPEPADTASAPASAAAGETLVGTIAIVGSAPVNVQVLLRTSDGRSIRVGGPLEPELRNLSGVEVEVRGSLSPTPDPIVGQRIEVSDFDVVSVDGRAAVMGEIISISSGGRARMRTHDGDEVELSGVPNEFRVGQKVWVQGPSSRVVQSYGVIRP